MALFKCNHFIEIDGIIFDGTESNVQCIRWQKCTYSTRAHIHIQYKYVIFVVTLMECWPSNGLFLVGQASVVIWFVRKKRTNINFFCRRPFKQINWLNFLLLVYFLSLHIFWILYGISVQLQLCVSRADIWDTNADNDCVLYNHGTCFMGKPVHWRAHSTPNRINKVEEKGLYYTVTPSYVSQIIHCSLKTPFIFHLFWWHSIVREGDTILITSQLVPASYISKFNIIQRIDHFSIRCSFSFYISSSRFSSSSSSSTSCFSSSFSLAFSLPLFVWRSFECLLLLLPSLPYVGYHITYSTYTRIIGRTLHHLIMFRICFWHFIG